MDELSVQIFLSTLSVRRATAFRHRREHRHDISIHALREESDPCATLRCSHQTIYIHALRVVCAHNRKLLPRPPKIFLSTLSVRRATKTIVYKAMDRLISIHALREESDHRRLGYCLLNTEFLSTLSVRRATNVAFDIMRSFVISIHALREESDGCRYRLLMVSWYFYPRSP